MITQKDLSSCLGPVLHTKLGFTSVNIFYDIVSLCKKNFTKEIQMENYAINISDFKKQWNS